MPRIRSVKHELFEDEALAECDVEARFLFIGLIAWSDDYGNQRANAALIRGHVYPYDEGVEILAVRRWLAQLQEVGIIRLYKVDGEQFVHIRGWEKHQRIDNAGAPLVPGPDEAEADDEIPVPMPDKPVEEADRGGSPRVAAGGEGRGKEGKGTTSAKTPTRDDFPMAFLLADLIAGNDPDGKWTQPSKSSCDAERLLKERDGREEQQIRHVVEFVQEDDFEQDVVHSMVKLRKRYGELLGKAQKHWKATHGGGKAAAGQKSARVEELIERGRAAAANAAAENAPVS